MESCRVKKSGGVGSGSRVGEGSSGVEESSEDMRQEEERNAGRTNGRL